MSTDNVLVPSESSLRDHFLDSLDGQELDLLAEYAGLCISVEKLESQLKTSFGDNGSGILRGILILVRGH
jgi:hypothetical protein